MHIRDVEDVPANGRALLACENSVSEEAEGHAEGEFWLL